MLGDIWLCLALDKSEPANDYSHIAFNVAADSYMDTVQRLQQANVQTWKSNHSEGHSFYFLDLDKHKLELHEGNLASRLNSVDGDPYDGWVRYER